MKSLCLFILLASILANAVSDTDVVIVDVSCELNYRDPKTCVIKHVDNYSRNASSLNILNADANGVITNFKMTDGHYTVMPLNLFQLFPNLVKLAMSTGLEAVTKENLVGGNKLKYLIVFDNKIKEIRAHTFDGMDQLEVINLEDNKLTKVESGAFAGATNLKKLFLGYNEIDTIEDGAFNIPTLDEIDLSHNKLQTLADDVFVRCIDLKIVHFYLNELIRIGNSIDNVPKLNMLIFSNKGVNITDFDFYAIARKPHLEYLIAESVALILDDTGSAINDSYTVERLDISGNDLSYPDLLHRLRNFRSLTFLHIGNNNFTTINDIENILEMFPKLHKLDMAGIPCKDEIINRLQTKYGEKVKIYSQVVVFN